MPNADIRANQFTDKDTGQVVRFTDSVATFSNVNEMQVFPGLRVGQKVRTLGYYAPGDGGGCDYEIVAAGAGSNYGFLYEQLTGSGLEAKLLGGGIMEDKTVYIPTDYGTLQEAIDDLSSLRATQGATIDLVIESGHSPSAGIVVQNGNYSHFIVSSIDAEVMLSIGFGKDNAFIEGSNARLPVLNCLVNGNNGEAGFGYKAHNSSIGFVRPSCGAKYCWQEGLSARYGCTVYAPNSIFTHNAVNAGTSSNIHAISSIIHADNAIATDSNYYGVQSTSGGVVSFRFGDASRASRYGIRARDQGQVDAESAICNSCGGDGIRAFISGYVNFRNGQANGCGVYGISCTRGSMVAANNCSLNDSGGHGAYIAQGSSMDLSEASILRSANNGVECISSTVTLDGATIKDGAAAGIYAVGASNVSARISDIQGNATTGISASGSMVDAIGAIVKGSDIGVSSFNGSTVNLTDADCGSNVSRGIYAYNGGRINATGAKCQKTLGVDTGGTINSDITCLGGGYISAQNAIGGVSKVVNSLTAEGVILR
jgi:hypothetical protein